MRQPGHMRAYRFDIFTLASYVAMCIVQGLIYATPHLALYVGVCAVPRERLGIVIAMWCVVAIMHFTMIIHKHRNMFALIGLLISFTEPAFGLAVIATGSICAASVDLLLQHIVASRSLRGAIKDFLDPVNGYVFEEIQCDLSSSHTTTVLDELEDKLRMGVSCFVIKKTGESINPRFIARAYIAPHHKSYIFFNKLHAPLVFSEGKSGAKFLHEIGHINGYEGMEFVKASAVVVDWCLCGLACFLLYPSIVIGAAVIGSMICVPYLVAFQRAEVEYWADVFAIRRCGGKTQVIDMIANHRRRDAQASKRAATCAEYLQKIQADFVLDWVNRTVSNLHVGKPAYRPFSIYFFLWPIVSSVIFGQLANPHDTAFRVTVVTAACIIVGSVAGAFTAMRAVELSVQASGLYAKGLCRSQSPPQGDRPVP